MKPGTLLGLLLAILIGVVGVRACTREPPRQEVGVTRDLFGRWTTQDPRYLDRFLEITASEIVFGLGAEGEARHELAGVWLDRARDGRRRYLVRYVAAADGAGDAEQVLEISLLSAPGELQIETLPDVRWRSAP